MRQKHFSNGVWYPCADKKRALKNTFIPFDVLHAFCDLSNTLRSFFLCTLKKVQEKGFTFPGWQKKISLENDQLKSRSLLYLELCGRSQFLLRIYENGPYVFFLKSRLPNWLPLEIFRFLKPRIDFVAACSFGTFSVLFFCDFLERSFYYAVAWWKKF